MQVMCYLGVCFMLFVCFFFLSRVIFVVQPVGFKFLLSQKNSGLLLGQGPGGIGGSHHLGMVCNGQDRLVLNF